MRLLVLSDIHDEEKALDFFDKFEYDIAVVTGDTSMGARSFLEEVAERAFLIPGNCESQELQNFIADSPKRLHMRVVEREGLKLIGCGFSNPTPFGTPGEKSEEELSAMLNSLPIDENTLLFTHVAPYGYFDEVRGEHKGSMALTKAIKEKRPKAVFFGHFHEYKGVAKVGDSLLIKVPAAMNWEACLCTITKVQFRVDFVKL